MTFKQICSLTSALVVTWIAGCGSEFQGGDAGSSGQAGNSGNGTGGDNVVGGGTAGKGGKSGGGSGGTDVVGNGGTDVVGSAGAFTGEGGGGTVSPGMAGADSGGAPSRPSCRVDALENVVFCDDFEDTSHPDWTHHGDEGLSVPVAEPVHHGNWALEGSGSPGSLGPLFTDALGEHTSGRLYARVWMYIPGDVTITEDPLANASLLVLGQAPPSDGGVSVAMWAGGKVTVQIYDPNDATALAQAGSYATPLPRDEWFCLRLDFPIGASVGKSEFNLSIGNAPLVNAEPDVLVDTTLSTPYERLWVGVNNLSPQQLSPVTAYYDDVVVDTQEISCD